MKPLYQFYMEWKSDEEDIATSMLIELANELPDLDLVSEDNQEYLLDLYDNSVYKAGDDSMMLTDEDLRTYPHLVDEADHRELEAFCVHKIFKPKLKSDLPHGANVVDCVWVRKWAIKYKKVKSRVCARGCFDKQKQILEKHSSTATRLSQRLVISMGLCNGILWNDTDDPYDIETESLDISTAFLQGLDYSELSANARTLG